MVENKANERQVGGTHYRTPGLQHWDLSGLYAWDGYQHCITKYVMRWRDKDGVEGLEKSQHFIEKYIYLVKAGVIDPAPRVLPPREAWLKLLGVNPAPVAVQVVPPGHVLVPRGSVAPTGWKGFTYEGDKEGAELYRCKACKEHFAIPVGDVPALHHNGCDPSHAGRGYVAQD